MATSTQHRVYIPTNARANHYLLAELIPNEDFYKNFSNSDCCYERIARQLFACCDEYELHNVHLLANDKLPVVRFHDESYQLETQKQMLFFITLAITKRIRSITLKARKVKKYDYYF